jgi:DNA-nicking Smr family endonuclease
MNGDDKKTKRDSESFADLIGETKPISRGPALAARSSRHPRVPRMHPSDGPASTFRWPDPDESRLAGAPGVSDAQLFALGRGEPEPEERIDLHGLRSAAASRVLRDRIKSARARGLPCVVVIHGRGQGSETGEAVLRDALPGWLSSAACAKQVLGFAPAPNRLGGAGATLVLLRRR